MGSNGDAPDAEKLFFWAEFYPRTIETLYFIKSENCYEETGRSNNPLT
ncbi:MAG: hypothetical protein F6K16_05470 [Symploca sp. SIO2B6]|nr:hypothetical protein [Symploca sp. SIO2B6]